MKKLHLVPSIFLSGGLARIVDPVLLEVNFSDPVDLAVELEEIGFDELLLVDVDGAITGNYTAFETLNDIVSYTQIDMLVGGGVRNEATVEKLFKTGAARVLLNTLPVLDQEKMLGLIDIYGSNSFVIGVDISDAGIMIEGRKKQDEIALEKLIGFYNNVGVDRFILQTSDNEGNKIAPDIDFFENVLSVFPRIRLYAGEGINDPGQFEQFENIGLTGVVIGDEFYTSEKLFGELRNYFFS